MTRERLLTLLGTVRQVEIVTNNTMHVGYVVDVGESFLWIRNDANLDYKNIPIKDIILVTWSETKTLRP